MEKDKKRFWALPPSSKLDELEEARHLHHIRNALADQETGIEKVDSKTYILYGEEQALLLRPVSRVLRWGVELYIAFLSLNSQR